MIHIHKPEAQAFENSSSEKRAPFLLARFYAASHCCLDANGVGFFSPGSPPRRPWVNRQQLVGHPNGVRFGRVESRTPLGSREELALVTQGAPEDRRPWAEECDPVGVREAQHRFAHPSGRLRRAKPVAAVSKLARGACGLTAAIVFVLFLGIASAQQPKSNDQKLLDELESDLLDDLPSAKKPERNKSEATDSDPLDKKLKDDLQAGEDLGSAPENPLENIGRQMRAASERIARSDTSEETQAEQGNVVRELEKLIEQAKKQGGSGNKSASGKGTGRAGTGDGQVQPGNPQESTDRVGKANTEPAQKSEVKDLFRRIWGHLPEKQRDEMQNAFSDQFLPKYEKLIEEYFQRLAEERASGP